MTRIYFNDKLISIITPAEVPTAHDLPFLIRDADDAAIDLALEKIHHHEAVTLVSEDPSRLFKSLQKKFTVIQAAGGFVYDADRLLFIFRKGKWDLPKGKLDDGESLETCAVREVEEETGLKNIKLEEKLQLTYHTYSEKGKDILKETHWFRMKGDSSLPLAPQKDEGIEECIWVNKNEREKYLSNSYELVREVVAKGLSNMKERK